MYRHLLSTLIALSLAGCTSGSNGGTGNKDSSTHPATVQGNARRTSGADPSQATITVVHVKSDGSTETASTQSATTDADGHYSVDVGVSGDGDANLIVQSVYSDGSSAELLLTGTVSEDDTRTAPPIDDETSAEANVFLQLVASGDLSYDGEESALVRAFIDASTGAAYDAADGSEQQLVASATASAAAAWTASSDGDSEGDTSAALDATVQSLLVADADADNASTAGDDASVDAMATLEAAWTSSGFSDVDLAYAMDASFEANQQMSGGASGDAVDASTALMASVRAHLMADVVSASWADAGMGSSSDADAANASLFADVSAILDGGDASSAWDDAVASYTTTLLADLAANLDLTGAAALTDAVAVAVSAQSDLSASIASASSSDAEAAGQTVATAMASYRASIDANVTASLTGSGAFDDTQASAMAQIVGQLYANAN